MKKVLLCAAFIATSFTGIAQVGIGTVTPDASAALEVKSTTSGLLPPRMTTAERDVINSGVWVEGLTIYNTDTKCLELYNGTDCISVCNGSVVTTPSITCVTDNISITSCIDVPGASENDDINTAEGTEYDWTGAPGNMTGGSTRALVEIGGQCWFRRNSVAAPTAPISDLPNVSPNIWKDTTVNDQGYWGYYNETNVDGSAGWSTTEPAVGEGLLYQWSAAMNGVTTERAQGVCPTDWHIPSDCEWMYLENSLGMTTSEQQLTDIRDSGSVGGKLISSSGGNNSSGFTALFPGFRENGGLFFGQPIFSFWWSSSETSDTNAYSRNVIRNAEGVSRDSFNKSSGYSVRCLKD
jgi:uncharacterized protein (TIGR02145 family)